MARRWAFLRYWPHALAGALAMFLLVFAAWSLVVNDPLGGEPMVAMAVDKASPVKQGESTPPPSPPKPDSPAQPKAGEATPPADSKIVTIIDGSSGRRQEVVVREPPNAGRANQESRLLETSRHGPIPKMGEDGARPSEVYAKPSQALPKDAVRIAIVVGGLGISALRTSEAIDKLPAAVTFAFTPYAKDLGQWVPRATQAGHELLLHAPMEPFDYPDNDPGPQTLLTSLAPEQNIDRLQWFMSRFQGYVGIVNHAGGRFTATEQAFSPVLREVARRGLIYLDDGSSPRSVASQIAGANNSAFAKADVVIDVAPTSSDIDLSLSRLEAIARERGTAIGFAFAFPVAIERIALWAKGVEERGIVLVPLSAAANKPKSS